MTLAKATLQAVKADASNPPKEDGPVITVQLNPTSLRYQLSNNTEVGKSQGRQAAQAQGPSSATLQFDLVFDTADEGTTANPEDVRKKVKPLEQFVLPNTKTPKSAPSRVKFTYGTFTVVGVMSALNQDYDLFSESGTPLRAKVSITIKEQKPEIDVGKLGAGANQAAAALPMETRPSPTGSLPTAPDFPPRDRTGTALAGESAADFAARMGLDPGAWKSFAAGLSDTLSLSAGLRIDFSASAGLTIGGGLGVQAGATAGAPGRGSRGRTAPGRDVPAAEASAAGGVAKALDQRAAAASAEEAADTRAAFGVSPPAPPAPAGSTGTAAPPPAGAQAASTPSPAPTPAPAPAPDPRATSYGRGVPLRPRRGGVGPSTEPLVVHTRCGKREGR